MRARICRLHPCCFAGNLCSRRRSLVASDQWLAKSGARSQRQLSAGTCPKRASNRQACGAWRSQSRRRPAEPDSPQSRNRISGGVVIARRQHGSSPHPSVPFKDISLSRGIFGVPQVVTSGIRPSPASSFCYFLPQCNHAAILRPSIRPLPEAFLGVYLIGPQVITSIPPISLTS